jgi:hypothetical protein
MVGLMKEGEDGSETSDCVDGVAIMGGCIDNPFMLRDLRGEGEVIGRSNMGALGALRDSASGDWKTKLGVTKLLRGTRLIGESGDEDGDGSDSGEESVVDMVVVGDESADSDICVDVLSWCRWPGSDESPVGCSWWWWVGFARVCSLEGSMPTSLGSTTVTVSRSAMVSASRSKTVMKDGIWSS